MSGVRLIAGLGNPGPRYADTRHNVGARLVRNLADRFRIPLVNESRFKGELGRGDLLGHDIRLLIPATYMNLSGESVGAVARFYRIESHEILIAYDEMAFEPGVVRLRQGGGANGHNGITSVIAGLGNDRNFHRLRIGVGHPGSREMVTAFLTSIRMPESERALVDAACTLPDAVLAELLDGNFAKAMNQLHAPAEKPSPDQKEKP
ncbi:MAG: aminoacyl-tRNA hydrolase [Pseudomonadales bacterium]|nr:aminoacyl-tRNA hydrolase [Pseudomonadales bacterium]